MRQKIKTLSAKDCLKESEPIELGHYEILIIISEVASVASSFPEYGILVDLRQTKSPAGGINELLEVASEVGKWAQVFDNKLASVIPDELVRIAIAEKFKSCMTLMGFHYEVFTDYDKAVKWLST